MLSSGLLKRHPLPLGALAVLGVVATSGCGGQGAGEYSSSAMNTDSSIANTTSDPACGEALQKAVGDIASAFQEPADETFTADRPVTYDDAVSEFGTVDEDAFGAYPGEGLIGFRFDLSGIFLGWSYGEATMV